MNSFYKSAIVLILLYSLFSMPALADDEESEFHNFIQSQFKNLSNSSLGTNTSSSDSNFVIEIGTLHDVAPGSVVDVPVTVYSPPWKMWGIELRIKYNPSVLSLSDVIKGDDFFDRNSGCGWEYFAWRQGPADHCGGLACPSGTARVLGIADLSLPYPFPTCYNPGSPADFISFRFLVTADLTEQCNLFPIEFIWYDCGDNYISYTPDIDSLRHDQFLAYGAEVFSNDSLIELPDSFPSLGGLPIECLINSPFSNEYRDRVIFHNGGVFIQCDSTPVLIGDVNANSVPYEVADALLFTNYFIYGEVIFTIAPEDQIAATDINKDGETLKLEDHAQLIGITLGDILPNSTIDSTLDGSIVLNDKGDKTVKLQTNYFIDMAWVMMTGDIGPHSLTDSSILAHHYDGSHTRILLGRRNGYGPGNVDLFGYTGEGEIVEAQAATRGGIEITLRIDDVVTSIEEPNDILPSDFALHQNYPNPFNNETVIEFDLPGATEVEFEIINILGQLVYNVTNRYSAGSHTIYWDGNSNFGQTVGSGVYYYRISAGDFVSSKKMILLK